MTRDNDLARITRLMNLLKNSQDNIEIKRDDIIELMNSDNISVLGAVKYFIFNKKYCSYIVPSLQIEEYHHFMIRYCTKCFEDNPVDDDWAESRYLAGYSLVKWFKSLWYNKGTPYYILVEIRDFLERIYETSNSDIRECIVNSVLEHLFKDKDIVIFFRKWRDSALLSIAYNKALYFNGNLAKLVQ